MPHHVGEGDILCGLRLAGDQPGVLLWEEALWNNDEQENAECQRQQEHDQSEELVPQDQVESSLVAFRHAVKGALSPLINAAVLNLLLGLEEQRTHGGRQSQRDES